MNTAAPTPHDAAEAADSWTVEYLPYTAQDGHEIPAYRVADADGTAICETNENAPDQVQAAHAQLIAALPKLIAACKAGWEMGYTLGDRDTQESRDLFSLYALCDEALQDAGLIP